MAILFFCALPLVFEFQIVHTDDVAVLNAHVLQRVEQTALTQHLVEVHPALVVGEVDVAHEPLEPRPLHQPGVVLPLDVQRLGGVDDRRLGTYSGSYTVTGGSSLSRWLMRCTSSRVP